MACDSERLSQLRPVSFRYIPAIDPHGAMQYGLVAEEVAAVMPELIQISPEGEVATVRYHLLVPLLLNEVQKQQRTIEDQRRRLEQQTEQIHDLAARLLRVENAMRAETESTRREAAVRDGTDRADLYQH